ncbi:MAG: TIR domain-containing protein [Hyphomonadaceae bacterium]|nr:TIR domain-containing protein [Hyphomonadaceae bacterium]
MSALFQPQLKPQQVTLHLFSSHSWKYGYHREGLHDLLSQEWLKGVDYQDWSIPSSHPEDADADVELMQILKQRMRICDVFLVFAGMYADRPWIRDEVTLAEAYDKPIIAIRPFGQERLSKWATRFAHERVAWRGTSIRDAILRYLPDERRRRFKEQIRRRKLASALLQHGLRPAGSTLLTRGIKN